MVENIVYLKGKKEIDFYISETNTALQVSYSIKDDLTRGREVGALCRYATTNKDVKPMINTWDESEEIISDGVTLKLFQFWIGLWVLIPCPLFRSQLPNSTHKYPQFGVW